MDGLKGWFYVGWGWLLGDGVRGLGFFRCFKVVSEGDNECRRLLVVLLIDYKCLLEGDCLLMLILMLTECPFLSPAPSIPPPLLFIPYSSSGITSSFPYFPTPIKPSPLSISFIDCSFDSSFYPITTNNYNLLHDTLVVLVESVQDVREELVFLGQKFAGDFDGFHVGHL